MNNKKGFGQMQFLISLIFISLFTFAIIEFSINFANDNNAAVNVANDNQIMALSNNSQSNLSAGASSGQDTYNSIVNTTISPFGAAQSVTPFTLSNSNAIGTTKNIIQVGYIKIFGSNNGFGVFLTSFIGILAIIFGFFVYKTLRGNPD